LLPLETRRTCLTLDRLARSCSLALAVGLAALVGFWLVRRNEPRTTRAGDGTSTSMAGPAMAFLIRFGWQRSSSSSTDSRASRQEHPAATMSRFLMIRTPPQS